MTCSTGSKSYVGIYICIDIDNGIGPLVGFSSKAEVEESGWRCSFTLKCTVIIGQAFSSFAMFTKKKSFIDILQLKHGSGFHWLLLDTLPVSVLFQELLGHVCPMDDREVWEQTHASAACSM